MKNEPGYSGPSFGGLVVAEDAGGTHPQGTSTPKAIDFMTMAIGFSKTAFSNSAPAYLVPYLPLRLQRNLR